jgi:protein-tyrosine-phosphatase
MSAVLFVCLHNAGRFQMSHALFQQDADGRHTASRPERPPALASTRKWSR